MDIFSEIVEALKKSERVVLATIVSSSGSTPLPTGSSMLMTRRGAEVLGTIGGGLLEAMVTKDGKEFFESTRESLVNEFKLNESGSEEGMICGGNVDVLIERIGSEGLEVFSRLAQLRAQGKDCLLLRRISVSGAVARIVLEETDESVASLPTLSELLSEGGTDAGVFLQRLQRSHREECVERLATGGGEFIIQPVTGVQPLLICGGGHVGRSVSRLASASGFTVTIVDERQEYATPLRFPEAVRTIGKPWGDAFSDLSITPSTSVVILTHGHQSDKEVLRLALNTPARYIGMIGSGRKVAATYDGLRNEGISVESLKRVHAPIGLEIGAVTADEIAVSIVAELIRERRRFQGVSKPLSEKMNKWFNPGK
jgi:xanthine dehydrogenase accessory factor